MNSAKRMLLVSVYQPGPCHRLRRVLWGMLADLNSGLMLNQELLNDR